MSNNWEELRVKGKFIKVKRAGDETQDLVISKFFYSFEVEEETEVIIGLHQEDKRNLGAYLRGYLPTTIIILKESEDDDEELEIFDYCDFSKDREMYRRFDCDEGKYYVVPFALGTLLQRVSEKKLK
jgi:hypothetical protein